MTPDLAFFQLFERLSPLMAAGKTKLALMFEHQIVARCAADNYDPASLAIALANGIPSLEKRFARAGLIVETPDHVTHFVRLV